MAGKFQRMQLKGNEVKTQVLTRPFNGFNISLNSIFDSTQSTSNMNLWINPYKIQVRLRNLATRKVVIDTTLARLYMLFKGFSLNGNDYLNNDNQYMFTECPLGVEGYYNTLGALKSNSQALSFKFPSTYQGVYELTIDMKDSVPVGSSLSYLSISPEWSDDAMIFETQINEYSIDSIHFDKNLGSGVSDIIITRDVDFGTKAFDFNTLSKVVKRGTYSSVYARESYDNFELRMLTNSFYEKLSLKDQEKLPMLVLHKGEFLVRARVEIESNIVDAKCILLVVNCEVNPLALVAENVNQNRFELNHSLIPVNYGK